jgi:hypothetical protein
MSAITTPGIEYFRKRRFGPEALMEDAINAHLADLLKIDDCPRWFGAYVPLGSGQPDLVIASCFSEKLQRLNFVDLQTVNVLSYLKFVQIADEFEISTTLKKNHKSVRKTLEALFEIEAITELSGRVSLSADWQDILPSVTTVEVKVSDWKSALQQALRNQIFAHQSYIAVPYSLAARVVSEATIARSGIGVIAVDCCNDVRVFRRARRSVPKVWSYYYKLATLIAETAQRYGISSRLEDCASRLSRV